MSMSIQLSVIDSRITSRSMYTQSTSTRIIFNTRQCYTKLEKSQLRLKKSLVFFLVNILFIKIDIMKFIGKLDNRSGEMGITHKGKTVISAPCCSEVEIFLSSPINNKVIDYFHDFHFI